MKTFIQIFFFLIFIVFNTLHLHAQSHFAHDVRYFYWGTGFNGPPNDVYSFVDSLYVTAINGDTINFEIKNDVTGIRKTSQFLKIGNKISLTGVSDTALLYDFDLKINDTFFLTNKSIDEKLILDSIVNIKLENGIDYRHFYLHSLKSKRIIWVENIGEKTHGWDYREFNVMDKPGLFAVCSSDSLIWSDSIYYWEFLVDKIKLKYEKPTCSFYELMHKVELDEILNGISAYPIPSNDFLNIGFNGNVELVFEIHTMKGEIIVNPIVSCMNLNEYQIDISNLDNGIYQLVCKQNNAEKRVVFVKVN